MSHYRPRLDTKQGRAGWVGRDLSLGLILLSWIAGCGVAPAPIKNAPTVVERPVAGAVLVEAQPAKAVGGVVPVRITITSGSEIPRRVVPDQIFAINDGGNRIAPVPPGEAAREAGNAEQLAGVLESAALSGAGGGLMGAGLGAMVGAVTGNLSSATAFGGALGAGWGAMRGGWRGSITARRQANQQIMSLALKPQELRRDFSVNGYVFFPAGRYTWIEVLLINSETGDTESYRTPWPAQ